MKLNTKMRYGTRALLEIAMQGEREPLSVSQIAESQNVSPKYLEAILGVLRAAGLVRSRRGPQGGYELTRPPQEITLREVFEVLEGPEAYVPCTDEEALCPRRAHCVTQEVWAEMYRASMEVLESYTLADLVARQQAKDQPVSMYHI